MRRYALCLLAGLCAPLSASGPAGGDTTVYQGSSPTNQSWSDTGLPRCPGHNSLAGRLQKPRILLAVSCSVQSLAHLHVSG
jgi:hypothetical protein